MQAELEQTYPRLGTIYSLCSVYYPNIRQRSDVLNRWNFLKTGFYEGIKVGHILVNDSDGSFAEITVVSTTPTSTLSFKRLFSGVDNTVKAGDAYHIENVDFTPWLTSGTDTDPAMPGFQGDFSSQYVDADSPQLSTSRGRVEEAADWAVGSSVLVFPGYYTNEYVYIYNKGPYHHLHRGAGADGAGPYRRVRRYVLRRAERPFVWR